MHHAVFPKQHEANLFGDLLSLSVINKYDGLLISWLITFHIYHRSFKEQVISWSADQTKSGNVRFIPRPSPLISLNSLFLLFFRKRLLCKEKLKRPDVSAGTAQPKQNM